MTSGRHRELDFRRREPGASPSDDRVEGLQGGLESLHAEQWTEATHHAD